jgi:hypothetical protein
LQGKSTVLYSPKKTCNKVQTKNNTSNFIAVNVAHEPPKILNCDAASTGLSIIFPKGLSLRIEKDFDSATLLKVVKVLEDLC